jgi:hypothetical protein
MVDAAEVEKRTDMIKARGIEIDTVLGGLKIMTGDDLERLATRIARGGIAVPIHCRDQPGVVHALMLQALEWGMPIMGVINKSYVPRNGDRISFESQLLHAVIEKNAPLKNRLRCSYSGEGDQRRCKVWATFKGEDKPHEYESETLAKLHPGHVTKIIDGAQKTYVKGSQLWDDSPDVQLFYSASRTWARMWCPDVLLGAYTPDELATSEPVDVTPVSTKITELSQRLRGSTAAHAGGDRGFDVDHVNSIIEGSINTGAAEQEANDEVTKDRSNADDDNGRGDGVHDRPDDLAHQSGGAGGVSGDAAAVAEHAGSPGAREEGDQSEIFPPDRKTQSRSKGKRK